MSVHQQPINMLDSKQPGSERAPVQEIGGIEWETRRPRPAKPSLLRRLLPGVQFSGPSRHVSTEPASTEPGDKPEPTDTLAADPSPTTSFLDRVLPAHRTYFFLSRRGFLIGLLLAVVLLLALIIGLSAGLARRSHHAQSLPLPTSSAPHTGDLTYYGPGLGACGWTSTADDAIVAVSHTVFDAAGNGNSNPNANPLCGRKIRVERDQGAGRGNKSVDVVVVDRCVGCEPTDLDLSPSAFAVLADQALGRVLGSWAWLD